MLLREKLPPVGADADLSRLTEFPAQEAAHRLRRLVVLGSSETALAVARDAWRRGLEPVIYDFEDGPAMMSRHGTALRAGPAAAAGDRPALVRELRELGDPRCAALIATSDDWLRRILTVRAQLSDGYQSLLIPDDDTLETCLDKARFTLWCREQRLPHPPSWCVGVEDRPPLLEGPFVVRPALTRHGMARRGRTGLPKAGWAADDHALAALLARFEAEGAQAVVSTSLLERPLIQYSVCFARRPGRFLGFVTEKVRPAPGDCDVGTFVSLRDEPSVLAFGRDIAERLDFHGIGEIEILHDRASSTHYVVEVNARPWLQYGMASAAGYDLLKVVCGVRDPHLPRGRSTDVHWWMPMADLAHIARNAPGGPLFGPVRTLVRAARATARANVYARLDWHDPAPALFPLARWWRG